jgi:hypothetical protein
MSQEHKALLPTQPSLGPLPRHSLLSQRTSWLFVACQFGAALCCVVAAYRAFHMQPAFGWALAAGALMLVGFILRNLKD